METRALTIHQPWAGLIAAGLKRVENRSWRTRYRGTVWIHAGQSRRSLDVVLPAMAGAIGCDGPFGAIIARAEIVDCIPYDEGRLFTDLHADPFAVGPWCWLLARIEPLAEPVACGGRQGLWRPDEELQEQCEHQSLAIS